MPFCDKAHVARIIAGKSVAIVGSGPGALTNPVGLVDSHDVVVRINNYKLYPQTGKRTDIYYSFFGTSIKKTVAELRHDGVKLCYAKCPDMQVMESDWHRQNGKMNGVDFRYIYRNRASWWFCPTYVTTLEDFQAHFKLLENHVPTTGFSAILDVLKFAPRSVFITGFDFFQSGKHNVNEGWRPGDPSDPIGHRPELERAWFIANAINYPITTDIAVAEALKGEWKATPIPVRQLRRRRRTHAVYRPRTPV